VEADFLTCLVLDVILGYLQEIIMTGHGCILKENYFA
jgi:hypothetical protein